MHRQIIGHTYTDTNIRTGIPRNHSLNIAIMESNDKETYAPVRIAVCSTHWGATYWSWTAITRSGASTPSGNVSSRP